MDVPRAREQLTGTIKLKKGTVLLYYLSFVAVTVLTAVSLIYGDLGDAVVGLPMIVILGLTIFTDRKAIHVPPMMIILAISAFVISLIGHAIATDKTALMYFANILSGINLGLIGLIMVYILLRSMPGNRNENRRVVSFISICIAIAADALIRLAQYILSNVTDRPLDLNVDTLMTEMGFILIGALLVALTHSYRKTDSLFGGILNSFLEENSEMFGMEDSERAEIQRLIEEGESEKLEFKSTLRTNLQTGETDKRMEKAVLKTIVAFLNSTGGNLLIGVADDGSIIGADVASFDNKDKMNLHLSNLISSQIGAAFLPNLSIVTVDFDDKTVIRVTCMPSERPVFLKEGKIEIFYVRKGPQSDELTGMTLINYVNNRRSGLRMI